MTAMSEGQVEAPTIPAVPKRSKTPALIGAAVVVILVAVAAFLIQRGSSSSGHTLTITGTLTLSDTTASMLVEPNGNCLGGGGFADIAPGAGIVVTNESGKTIAVSSLPDDGTSPSPGTCVFAFAVKGVPAAKFYGIQVAHRGGVQFPADQIANVALTLG